MLLVILILFTISCIVLVYSNNLLVKSLSKISYFFKLSEFAIGFILVALATSLPELFVGVMSALDKVPGLSIGNVIGSNIVNMTVIVGIAAILARSITIESTLIKRDILYMLLIIVLPIILIMDHYVWNYFGLFPDMIHGLSRWDGMILLVVFGLYMYNLIKQQPKFSKLVESAPKREVAKNIGIFLGSITCLILSAHFVVAFATELSVEIAVPPLLLGLFLVAAGTTLPELVFTIKAVMMQHESMAIGDLVGSVIINSTLVLGVTALIHPMGITSVIYLTSALFMLFCAFVFFTVADTNSKITWKEGIFLIFMYIFFTFLETFVKNSVL